MFIARCIVRLCHILPAAKNTRRSMAQLMSRRAKDRANHSPFSSSKDTNIFSRVCLDCAASAPPPLHSADFDGGGGGGQSRGGRFLSSCIRTKRGDSTSCQAGLRREERRAGLEAGV